MDSHKCNILSYWILKAQKKKKKPIPMTQLFLGNSNTLFYQSDQWVLPQVLAKKGVVQGSTGLSGPLAQIGIALIVSTFNFQGGRLCQI